MIEFAHLRPADSSVSAIMQSLSAVQSLAPQIAAVLTSAERARDDVLMTGTPESLAAANAFLAEVISDGLNLNAMHRELEVMLAAAAGPAETEPPAAPTAAAAKFAEWMHVAAPSIITEVTNGLRLLTAVIKAADAPATAASNVVPIQKA